MTKGLRHIRAWWWAVPGALLLALLLLLQTPWGLRIALTTALRESGFTLAGARGNWVLGIEAYGIEFDSEDVSLHVDTLRARYNLFALARGKVHVKNVAVVGADLRIHATADDTSATEEPLPIRVDDALIYRSQVSLPLGQDTTLRVGVDYAHGILSLGSDVMVRLDTANLVVHAGQEPLRVVGPAALRDGTLFLDSVRVYNARTDAMLVGYSTLPEPGAEVQADLVIRATPLVLQDFELFTRLSGADTRVFLDCTVTDAAGRYRVVGEAFTPGGGLFSLDATAEVGGAYTAHMVSARDLELSLIDTSIVGTLSADLTGQLTGSNVGQMTGVLHLNVLESTALGLALDGGDARLALSAGTADFDMGLRISGTRVRVAGTAEDLEAEPRYALEGVFEGLDLSRFGAPVASNLGGALRLVGQGANEAEVQVRIGPGDVGMLTMREATVEARLGDQALSVSASAVADTGSILAQGLMSWDNGQVEIQASGQVLALDVASALSLAVESALSGEVSLHTRGGWPPDSGSVVLALSDSHFDTYDMDTVHVQGILDGPRVAVAGGADLAAGHIAWAGTARPFDAVPSYGITEATFDSVNVGLWVEGWRSNLQGAVQLHGRGADSHTLALSMLPSTLNDQRIDSGRVGLSLRGAQVEGATAMHMPTGRLDLSLLGKLPDSEFAITGGTFRNIDLGAILGLKGLRTQLSGAIDTLGVTGSHPAALALAADMYLDESRINDQVVDQAWLQIKADSGYYAAKGAVSWEGGGIQVDTAMGRWLDVVPSYEVQAMAEAVDLGAMVGVSGSYTGTVALAGKGITPSTLAAGQARLTAKHSRYKGIAVHDFEATAELADGLLRIDTVRIVSDAVRLSGGGSLTVQGGADEVHSITAGGVILDAGPLAALFTELPVATDPAPGDTLWVAATSEGDTIVFDGHAQLGGISAGATRILGATAGVEGTFVADSAGHRSLGMDSIWADMHRVSIPNLSARSAWARATLEGDTLAFRADVAIDEQRSATVQGLADLANQLVLLQKLDMNLGPERWHLDQESKISFGEEYRVRNLLLVAPDQEIALDGVVDLDGRQSLALTLFDFRPASVADLFGLPDLGGIINGDIFLFGDAAAPHLDGAITMALEVADIPVGALDATVSYADGRLHLDANLAHADSSTLMIAGNYPVDLRLEREGAPPMATNEVALVIDADSFNVGWVEPFLDPAAFGDVEGRLSGDIHIGGTTARPQLLGAVTLDEGQLELPELGLSMEAIQANATLEGDSVYISRLSAVSGGGSLKGEGTIGLAALTLGAFDLRGTAERFKVIDNEGYLAHVTGEVRLSGTSVLPELTGNIRLVNADIRPTEAANQVYAPVAFTPEDVRMLERYFNIRVADQDTTTFVFYDALAMALRVVVGEDVWLRSRTAPEMNVPFQGVVDITKASGEGEQVLGTVQVVPAQSYVRQFGRRFEIERGRLTFTGPALNPLIELRASYAVPARNNQDNPVTIYLDVIGSILDEGELSLQLSSDPAILDESDIISYIATGRPAAEAFQMAEVNTLQVGRDIAVKQLTNLIAGAAGAELGLDVVEIEQEGSRGITLTAGKRISRDLFASVSWPIALSTGRAAQPGTSTEGNKQIIIEYSLFEWFLARLRGDAESVGASFLFQYAY